MNEISHLREKAHYSFNITLVFFCALLCLLGYWNLTRASGINWPVWLAQTTPLLLLLPGMLKKYYRSFSWLCFLMLFYFIKAVESTAMSTSDKLDYLFAFLTVCLFISSMFTSRWLQRHTLAEAAGHVAH